jgi:hypothetical protein
MSEPMAVQRGGVEASRQLRLLRLGFFQGASIAMLVVVFVGFAPSFFLAAFFAYLGPLPLPPHLHLHGALLTGWYVWFALQTFCVAAGRTHLHRRLGVVGVCLGVAAAVSGVLTSLRFWPRWTRSGFELPTQVIYDIVWWDFAFLACFLIFLAAGIRCRRRPHLHKRLLFLASTSVLPPASTRILGWPIWGLESNHGLALLCAAAVPLIALAAYDVKAERRLHPVTIVGGGAMVTTFALCGLVIPSTEPGARAVSLLYDLLR